MNLLMRRTRGEKRRARLVSVLVGVGLLVLMAPVVASAPCGSVWEIFAEGVPHGVELTPVPCKAEETLGGVEAQGRFGPLTAAGCPGNCGYCGCDDGGALLK